MGARDDSALWGYWGFHCGMFSQVSWQREVIAVCPILAQKFPKERPPFFSSYLSLAKIGHTRMGEEGQSCVYLKEGKSECLWTVLMSITVLRNKGTSIGKLLLKT